MLKVKTHPSSYCLMLRTNTQTDSSLPAGVLKKEEVQVKGVKKY